MLCSLRVLCDDVQLYPESLASLRRRELTEALREQVPPLLPPVAEMITNTMAAAEEEGTDAADAAPGSASALLGACLRMLSACLQWVPMMGIFSTELLPLFCALLGQRGARGDACACVTVLCERPLNNLLKDIKDSGVAEGSLLYKEAVERMLCMVHALAEASAALVGPSVEQDALLADDEDYGFARKLSGAHRGCRPQAAALSKASRSLPLLVHAHGFRAVERAPAVRVQALCASWGR